jgi:hypothetical protein
MWQLASHNAQSEVPDLPPRLLIIDNIIYIYIQDGKTALELVGEPPRVGLHRFEGARDRHRGHGEVVGVLIAAGMAAGQWQDVNACLGSVIFVCVCLGICR